MGGPLLAEEPQERESSQEWEELRTGLDSSKVKREMLTVVMSHARGFARQVQQEGGCLEWVEQCPRRTSECDFGNKSLQM